jgi:hypothetical protein
MQLPGPVSVRALASTLSAAALAALIAGCGGSLDGHDYVAPGAPSTLSGSVDVGAPMRDATVSVRDAKGIVVGVPADDDGSYRGLSLEGLTAPFELQACGLIDGKYGCYTRAVSCDGAARCS